MEQHEFVKKKKKGKRSYEGGGARDVDWFWDITAGNNELF